MHLLQSVNNILTTVGEFPVDSLDSHMNPMVQQILSLMQQHKTALLNKGYWFNRELVTIQPDSYGQAQLPDAALNYYMPKNELILHGARLLYTEGKRLVSDLGYTWKQPLRLTVIMDKEFDDLPDVAQQVITYQTAHSLYLRLIGNDATAQGLIQREQMAQIELKREDLRHDELSMLNPCTRFGRYSRYIRR